LRARHGTYSPNEFSDDDSWDSDLADSIDSDASDDDLDSPRHISQNQIRYYYQNGRTYYTIEDEDEFERDPWNAVCVIGLRVFSKDAEVSIEVQHGETEKKRDADAESIASVSTIRRRQKELDVDDSAADATSPMRTKYNIDDALKGEGRRAAEAELISHVGTAPANNELSRQGTLS
jgi:hypothetical protein